MNILYDNNPVLVLDLDETIIHYSYRDDKHIINYRPGLFNFLNKIKFNFNIFIFTAGTREYANNIVYNINLRCKYNIFKGLKNTLQFYILGIYSAQYRIL